MSDSANQQDVSTNLEARLDMAIQLVLSEPVPTESIARVKSRALAIHDATRSKSSSAIALPLNTSGECCPFEGNSSPIQFPFHSRRLLMKCVSIASVVTVVAALFLMHASPHNVYGDVLKQLREARSFSYTKRLEVEGKRNPIQVRIFVAEDGRQRHEQSGGSIMILDPTPQIRLTLLNSTKTAIVSEPHTLPANRVAKHPLEWLDILKSHGDKPDKQLGKKMLSGREVEGYMTLQGQSTYTIWIDRQSKELVQVEHDMPVNGVPVSKVVMSDFRFNEKYDESLFSFNAPEGFKTINSKRFGVSQTLSGESGIIEALRGYTRKSGGKFPEYIADMSDFASMMSRGSSDDQIDAESNKTIIHFSRVLPFLSSLRKSDYAYLGAGKTVDDQRCIVFWYRDKSAKLRAIYNDLSVSDVQEKDIQ